MNRRAFVLSMMAIVLSWGLNYVVTKVGVHFVPPLLFVFWRFVLTAAFLLYWMRRQMPRTFTVWGQVALLGWVGISGYQWLFATALHKAPAATVAFLFDLSPVLTLILQRISGGRPLSRAALGGMLLAFTGVGFLVGGAAMGLSSGDIYAVAAALAWAVFTVLTDRFHVPLGGMALTGWMALFGSLALLPFVWSTPWGGLQDFSMGSSAALGYTVILVTIMGLSLWQTAVVAAGAASASVYLYLIPIVAAAAGWVFLDEAMDIWQFIGALGILLGVMTAEGFWTMMGNQRKKMKQAHRTESL
ncbi:MAG: DMT family transporter [Firmicutes bacterium]|nr:DMT family transporter [Bacillota bacterium]